jgi:hypothetical protein
MLRKDRRIHWGKTEEDGGEEQKKTLGEDRKRCWGRTIGMKTPDLPNLSRSVRASMRASIVHGHIGMEH